jgi:hypothetical protein
MKVFAVREPARRTIAVYVEQHRDNDGTGYFEAPASDGGYQLVKVAATAEPPLWARIPMHIAEAVGEALAPRPEATERHLEDAISVRDRLLTLIEARP